MTSRRNLLLSGGAVVVAGTAGALALGRDMGSLDAYRSAVASTRAALQRRPEIREILRYATLAPSGHNTQPWMFRVSGPRIEIHPDTARRTPVVDPDDHHLFVSLGCAAETLALASAAAGRPGDLSFAPAGPGVVVFESGPGAATASPLFGAIPRRQSTRGDYDGRPVSADELRALAAAATMPDVDLILVTDRSGMGRLRDLVIDGNSVQMADPAFLRELRSWMRFNPRDALHTGDGLFSATTGNPILPGWLGPGVFDLAFKAPSENARYARQIASSAGLAVFVGHEAGPQNWVSGGRAAQRFGLQATALGLKTAFINQPVEVAALRPALADLVGMKGRRPDLMMRFGRGSDLPYAARRPVRDVLAGGLADV